jgi:hypothetical protein
MQEVQLLANGACFAEEKKRRDWMDGRRKYNIMHKRANGVPAQIVPKNEIIQNERNLELVTLFLCWDWGLTALLEKMKLFT